jgi:small subunit ribosomal protein S13
MPVRISGINLNDKSRIEISLTAIYGIGRSYSREILNKLNIDVHTKTAELTGTEEKSLRDYIENNVKVEGELKREISQNIRHQKDVGSYRGARHQHNLPARGQRTRTNSRTVRGNVRRTAGSGRKSGTEKT